MNKNIPVYKVVLNEESKGVGFISLVDEPAIQVDWIKLAKQEMNFKANKDQQMLYGPFLIPNKNIYRYDDRLGEYYVQFDKEQIIKIAEKFNEDLNSKNINFQHTDRKIEAFVASNWMVEGNVDKSNNYGFDLPDGTWFGGVKIKDEKFWNEEVKTDMVKGFSVEISADLELQLKETKKINIQMEKEIKLGSAMLKDGINVYWDGEFGMGTIIYTDEALTTLAPDADHLLEDGTIVTTKDGVVVEIQVSAVTEVEDLAVTEPVAVAEISATLTASEVSSMIDARFADLVEEITKMKELISQKDEAMTEYKAEVKEMFSLTPAKVTTITKEVSKLDGAFSKAEQRIREFSKR